MNYGMDGAAETLARRRRITIISDDPSLTPGMPLAGPNDHVTMSAIADGIAVLAELPVPDLVIIELDAIGHQEHALLGTIDAMAADDALTAIVIFPRDCIDGVMAQIASPGVTLLCDPDPIERVAAIGFAIEHRRGGVREADDMVSPGLRTLADEVARIAKALAALAGDAPRPGGDVFSDGLIGYRAEPPSGGSGGGGAGGQPVGANEVRALIRARRLRDRFLPPDLFGEPAWDMLLDLLAARIERSRVAVSSLCIAAAVPPTTALRTIRAMTERGLCARVDDPADRRRVFIELTEQAASAMLAYVAAARSI